MTTAASYIDGVIDDGTPWYAVRLFTLKLEEVRTYFTSHGLECFVPEQYVDVEGHDGKPHSVLRPVVVILSLLRNLEKRFHFRRLYKKLTIRLAL